MSKFKKGDEVVVAVKCGDIEEGTTGIVTEITTEKVMPILVKLEGYSSPLFFQESELEIIKKSSTAPTKVKSDGGSSSYYELTITNKNGESIKCETGDVIRSLVGNDFDLGNCVKALRRIYLSSIGQGKEGVDVAYDCNKVRYFIGEVERVNK